MCQCLKTIKIGVKIKKGSIYLMSILRDLNLNVPQNSEKNLKSSIQLRIADKDIAKRRVAQESCPAVVTETVKGEHKTVNKQIGLSWTLSNKAMS